MSLLAKATLTVALVLAACILLYDATHKLITLSPVLMALCRMLLYLMAASAAYGGITGLGIWCGIALAAYIVGLSYIARQESTQGSLESWPCVLRAVPILLAWVANTAQFRVRAVLISALLTLWIIRCLGETFWVRTPNLGRTVSGLLAGICLVDFLAVVGGGFIGGAAFLVLFAAALLTQRFVPAT